MLSAIVAAALASGSSVGIHLHEEGRLTLVEGVAARRVHIQVRAPTREVEIIRVDSVKVRVGYYVATYEQSDRVCRGTCNVDVDVDPRFDYILHVEGEDPQPIDMLEHGESLMVTVKPPPPGLRTGGTFLMIGGIAFSVVGALSSLFGILELPQQGNGFFSPSFGIDPAVKLALGITTLAVGVAGIIFSVILKRRAVMEIETSPGELAPVPGPLPGTPATM